MPISTPPIVPSTGSCLCRKVVFTLTDAPLSSVVCHCITCQRSCGSAFTSNLICREKDVVIPSDCEPFIRWFHDTSTESGRPMERGFCNSCGSSLFIKPTPPPGKKPTVIVASGTVDGIQEKGGKWLPTVEVFCEPWRRSWIRELKGLRSFGRAFSQAAKL